MKEIKISTIYVWIISQTILSILFYLNDDFIDGWEALSIFISSFPITIFVQWLRGEYKFADKIEEDQEN